MIYNRFSLCFFPVKCPINIGTPEHTLTRSEVDACVGVSVGMSVGVVVVRCDDAPGMMNAESETVLSSVLTPAKLCTGGCRATSCYPVLPDP